MEKEFRKIWRQERGTDVVGEIYYCAKLYFIPIEDCEAEVVQIVDMSNLYEGNIFCFTNLVDECEIYGNSMIFQVRDKGGEITWVSVS